MTTQKHTPGPWHVGGLTTSCGISVRADISRRKNLEKTNGAVVAQVKHVGMPPEFTSSECGANARLIALAPEMAEALRAAFYDKRDLGAVQSDTMETIAALIAKLDGDA